MVAGWVALNNRCMPSTTAEAQFNRPHASLAVVDALRRQFAIKHGIDRAVAVLALLVFAPLLLVIALAVRLSSPGPVLFRQRRIGRHGEIFELYKFRTMVGAPPRRHLPLTAGVAPGGVEGADRRTGVGRWLRASSLDELPQLLNVLRGEMSLIGPRPERPEFAARFAAEIPSYADRHRVRCGITGWAQANGLRGQTSIADRVAYDNYYIDNWSLGLELRTLVLTMVEVLRFREARTHSSRRAVYTNRSRRGEPVQLDVFSSWPPNSLRIADNARSAKSSRPREPNREYSAEVRTGAGTPSSIAAVDVQRPSPESDTRPENSSSVGERHNAWAVKSSSHEPITLPRRQTSVTSVVSISYW